jgi:Resolvase, N terminal domain
MRKIYQTLEEPEDDNQGITRTLRTHKPTAGYARRSPTYAKDKNKDKTQSREMQTEDLRIWTIVQGWREEDFHPYFADLGLSGTLRPDQRPDMLRLFDDIDAGKFDSGSVICYQENRLFRDETQIYYNQFIQKCKDHDVVVVAVSPYLIMYDFRDDLLTEMFRWKCKEAAEFIKRQVKGWMHPARERAAKQGLWAGLGDVAIGYVVDYDPKSPTYKRLIPYEPHARIVRWLFDRFMELCGDMTKLRCELVASPVVFPPFPSDMDARNLTKNRIMTYSNGSLRTRSALESILTNRTYIGWRVVKGHVVKKDSQDPIVDRDVFEFAFSRLTNCTLDGELLEENETPKRYYRRTTKAYRALFKDRITSTQGEVYVHASGHYTEEGKTHSSYVFMAEVMTRQPGFTNRGVIEIGRVESVDELVVNQLFEHVRTIGNLKQYEEELAKQQAKKQSQLQSITESIARIPLEQANIASQIGKTQNVDARGILLAQIEVLSEEKKKLLSAKEKLEKESGATLQSLEVELHDLEANWPKYSIDRRIALINFLVKEVVVDVMAPHWIHLQVLWLHEKWGREEMYYCRAKGSNNNWSEEDRAILREHYPTSPRQRVMALLPSRGWASIRAEAKKSGIRRRVYNEPGDSQKFSHNDLLFMQEKGLTLDVESTNWEGVYLPATGAADN